MTGIPGWIGPNTPYLILHSRNRGIMDKPWIVLRCWSNTDEQEELFMGERADAMAFLKNNWDSNNS